MDNEAKDHVDLSSNADMDSNDFARTDSVEHIYVDPLTQENPHMTLDHDGSAIEPLDFSRQTQAMDPEEARQGEIAAAERYVTDLGQETLDATIFKWSLRNWRKLERRLVSDEFECGNTKWRVLLFPTGNGSGGGDMVSLYLEHVPPADKPDLHVCAQFALLLANPNVNENNVLISNQAHHRFVPEETDWGFTRFSELHKLFHPAEGQSRPVIENDACDIYAYVKVFKDPTGVLWHNFNNYDSKKETGHVGLKNQGATCYMNSLLQSLYYTPAFRRAVYQIPTEDEVPSESVTLALQRVFYQLQSADEAPGTIELTKSFGWKSLDSFLQHDVQEFNRVLQDKLETKMKKTKVDGAITKLFVGKMKSYIKCVNVDYESSRLEDFYDIQLNVKGLKNLQESFKDYIAVEDMNGDNQYMAEGHGLQDAKKGVIFQSFPPVLHLQLKRFEYDMQRDTMVKINDRHEFPYTIDLSDYVDPTVEQTSPSIYHLHGVLVHSGDLSGGHYFALIKPEKDSGWFKYDDDRVTHVTDREVLEDNFGGEYQASAQSPSPLGAKNQAKPLKRFTNAYMLVYVRESEMDEVLRPITEEETPAHLRNRLEEERNAAETKRKEREEQHLYLNAKLVTEEHFKSYQGFDLAVFEEKNVPVSSLPSFKVKKEELYSTFKTTVAEHCKLKPEEFRLWVMVNRQNKTTRPDTPISESDPNLNMEGVRSLVSSKSDLRLYLEMVDPTPPASTSNESTMMLMIKFFDVAQQTLKGMGKITVSNSAKVQNLMAPICELIGYPTTTPLRLYEEIKSDYIERMSKLNATLIACELQDGDIICCQVELSDAESATLADKGLFIDPVQFYEHLNNRLLIRFRPRNDFKSSTQELALVFNRKASYDEMAQKVGKHLKHDPMKLRFLLVAPGNINKQHIKRSANQNVGEIVNTTYAFNMPAFTPPAMLYDLLDVSITELETKKSLKVIWTGAHNKEESSHSLLLPKTSNVADLVEHLMKLVKLEENGSGKVRVFDMTHAGRGQREFAPSELVGNMPDSAEVFAEEIAVEELRMVPEEKLITVFHYNRDPSKWHGVPFRLVIRPGEKFVETKARLQTRLAVSEKEFAKFKFFLIQAHVYKQPLSVEDDDVLFEHKFMPDDVLGIDHIDRSAKANKNAEKAITIR